MSINVHFPFPLEPKKLPRTDNAQLKIGKEGKKKKLGRRKGEGLERSRGWWEESKS